MKSHNSGTTEAITVLTTPTLIKGHYVEPNLSWAMANMSAVTVYFGYDNTVTTASGFPLAASERISEDGYHGNVYAVVASGTAEVRAKVY
jgi:hypothetical protein